MRNSSTAPAWRIAMLGLALLVTACQSKSGADATPSPDPGRITEHSFRTAYPAPDDWHRLALFGNWDFIDAATWRAIVTSPECDRATALAIFWKLQPDYYVEFVDRAAVPEVNREGYDLIALIRERWSKGLYSRAELAFDPAAEVGPVDYAALQTRYGSRVDRIIPPAMRAKLDGRNVSPQGFHAPGVYGAE